ncbi:MAG: NADH-quinone oxidoreductase subunit K [Candidatus Bathyarchaeia archaeon]|jgi:NADH:ubiquinone oxidoreductase subunit K
MLTDQTIFLTTSTLLIFLGLFAIFYSRNLLKTIISFQIVVFGANLALFSSGLGEGSNLMANTLVLFSIVVGGSVEAVGLALIVLVHKQYGTLDPWEIRRLRH